MSFGGVQGMITTLKNNRIQKGERKTLYDRDNVFSKGTYGKFVDHIQMKSHEFANFQKEQFFKKKQDRIRERKLRIIALVIVGLIILLFLYVWNSYDFDVLVAPLYK